MEEGHSKFAFGEEILGVKTFWPRNYTTMDILQASEEFFLNENNFVKEVNKQKRFLGRISNGLKLKGNIGSDGKITSIYPFLIQ